jgi:hypothetical protein
MIHLVDSGLVYRNPQPHLRSIHAWHPSLVRLDGGELVASFDLAQAVEALDYCTHVARSADGGRTWTRPVPMLHDRTERPATHSVRISRLADGTLVGFGGRYYRDDPEHGVVNRENLGYTPMDLILVESGDGGRTWQGPRTIAPPLVGPAFETCHAIVELPDGRWLAPTATWKGWNGEAPNGMQAIALVSRDGGRSWPEWLAVMDGYRDGLIHWEQSLVRLADGRLLAVCWVYDERAGKSRPNAFALSRDGTTFGPPRPTGTRGQTAKVVVLGDGRLVCLYRGDDRPGLWAELARIEGDDWVRQAELRVWQGAPSGMQGAASSGEELAQLKFGYPSPIQLPDGDVLALFWCLEDCLHVIRWVRLRVA